MINLDLTPEEQRILAETLNIAISDLSMEIADTDRMDYREMLKTRRTALSRVLQSLH